ncbi:YcaO-like family protein [Modestobacter sp. NPDC049651]|uniref:YcaO-like family protein n=1 Tax=unclassified Modestobacter TaxID=2643866 RepID=UPI0033F0C21E
MSTPTQRYLASFPDGVEEFAVEGLDTLDVPLHSAFLASSPAHPGGSGLGYGATREEARTGALGEMAEMALSIRAHQGLDRVHGSYRELARTEGRDRVQDPRTLCLEAGSDYDDDRSLQWLPMTRTRDGEQVLVPAELVVSAPEELPGDPPPAGWLTTVITNGQGAAFDADRAVRHAVLELLQRDGNATTFRALDQGVVLDLAGLRDPDALALLDRLDAAGIDVLVKLASSEHGVVSVYAVGCSRDGSEPDPVMVTACGEAADPDPDAAVRKALFEFAAARSRKAFMHGPLDAVAAATPPGYLDQWLRGHPPERMVEEDRALQAMLGWTRLGTDRLTDLLRGSVLSRRSTVALADLPAGGADVLAGLTAEGLDVLVDLQPSQGDAVAAKVLVPGLEAETMSYGRIGERGVRRLLDREGPGAGLAVVGADPGGWARVHLTADAEERLGGPAWFDRAGADRVVGELYALYREPGRHVAALAAGVAS